MFGTGQGVGFLALVSDTLPYHSSTARPGWACHNSCWSYSCAAPRAGPPPQHPPAWTHRHPGRSRRWCGHCLALSTAAAETATASQKGPLLGERSRHPRGTWRAESSELRGCRHRKGKRSAGGGFLSCHLASTSVPNCHHHSLNALSLALDDSCNVMRLLGMLG